MLKSLDVFLNSIHPFVESIKRNPFLRHDDEVKALIDCTITGCDQVVEDYCTENVSEDTVKAVKFMKTSLENLISQSRDEISVPMFLMSECEELVHDIGLEAYLR